MHVLFMNSKGGTGKSTLVEYAEAELSRLGYTVDVTNTDQQQHVKEVQHENTDLFLYDTAGAFTEDNVHLLTAIAENPDLPAKIIVPIGSTKNDRIEIPFLMEAFQQYGVLDRVVVVLTKVRKHSKAVQETKQYIKALGLPVAKQCIPQLEDFGQGRHTSRTRNEISGLIHEVIL